MVAIFSSFLLGNEYVKSLAAPESTNTTEVVMKLNMSVIAKNGTEILIVEGTLPCTGIQIGGLPRHCYLN